MSASVINGKIRKDTGPEAAATTIQQAGSRFRSEGYSSGNNGSDLFQARLVLNSLNIVVSRETKYFTLAGAENRDRGIDNPTIIDPDIVDLTPEPTTAEDKFPVYKVDQIKASTDYFYEQDEDLTDRQKADASKITAKTQVMFKLAQKLSSVRGEAIGSKSINKYTTRKKFRRNIDE